MREGAADDGDKLIVRYRPRILMDVSVGANDNIAIAMGAPPARQ